jgi:putative hydrolases of HD superfamily
MSDLIAQLAQVGALKRLPRAGWLRVGLPEAESVADHSFRTAVLALMLADELGVDAARLVALVLVHDLPESDPDVGDITPFCGVDRVEKRRRERAAMERLCAERPDLLALWAEYDEGQTPEADAAHQLDALEMAIQSREYEGRHDVDLAEFRESARKKIHHPALLRLLDDLDRAENAN